MGGLVSMEQRFWRTGFGWLHILIGTNSASNRKRDRKTEVRRLYSLPDEVTVDLVVYFGYRQDWKVCTWKEA
jgi:hypothetical protein